MNILKTAEIEPLYYIKNIILSLIILPDYLKKNPQILNSYTFFKITSDFLERKWIGMHIKTYYSSRLRNKTKFEVGYF